ncbi:UNVERIFIED_CONTAM: hypothetical protein FKN15_072556 [Acipenser sinensis]
MNMMKNRYRPRITDFEELIEEHLISHEEVMIGQSTFIPLSPTWLLETQGYNEQDFREDIQPEIQSALVVPEDFLNHVSVTADTPKERPTRRTLIVDSESSEDETSFIRDPKSKRPPKICRRVIMSPYRKKSCKRKHLEITVDDDFDNDAAVTGVQKNKKVSIDPSQTVSNSVVNSIFVPQNTLNSDPSISSHTHSMSPSQNVQPSTVHPQIKFAEGFTHRSNQEPTHSLQSTSKVKTCACIIFEY